MLEIVSVIYQKMEVSLKYLIPEIYWHTYTLKANNYIANNNFHSIYLQFHIYWHEATIFHLLQCRKPFYLPSKDSGIKFYTIIDILCYLVLVSQNGQRNQNMTLDDESGIKPKIIQSNPIMAVIFTGQVN